MKDFSVNNSVTSQLHTCSHNVLVAAEFGCCLLPTQLHKGSHRRCIRHWNAKHLPASQKAHPTVCSVFSAFHGTGQSCTKAVTDGAYAIGMPYTFLQQSWQRHSHIHSSHQLRHMISFGSQERSQTNTLLQTVIQASGSTIFSVFDSTYNSCSKTVTSGTYAVGIPNTFPQNELPRH